MKKIWKINKKAPKSFLNKFPEYSRLTLQLLWDRGLKSQKAIDEFFSPDYDQDLLDPFLLKDIKKVIKRIEKAAKDQEKVAIFADFDTDGVCGATILTEIFKVFKIKPEIYIPDRNLEGYGLNLKAIREFAKKEVGLILTIDCGVTDFEEIKLANKLGIDVIIVDHHEIPKNPPPAFAMINPKQKTCRYPFKHLSATGVAFKLLQAVRQVKKIPVGWEKWLLDLVALSTVADTMLLLGENRTLVKYGLIVLSQTRRVGLEALMEKARINKNNLDTYVLGFILSPRLNAASRVGHGTTAYKLLTVSDKREADELAQELEEKNQKRQRLMEKIFQEVKQRVLKYPKDKKIIIEGDENWIAGLSGLIAQKLKEEFWRPCFIYKKEKKLSSGSSRSIPGFDLVQALSQCQKYLEEFGGHSQAAGFRVFNRNLDKFQDLLEKFASQKLKPKDLIPYLQIDVEVELKDLTWQFFEEIQKFSPFGEGNQAPLFVFKGLTIFGIRNVGSNGNHLKLCLKKEGKKFNAIGFNLSSFYGKLKLGDRVDIIFELISNEWNGTKSLEFKVRDLKKV